MELPVVAIVTSAQCGHCVLMRGNGDPLDTSPPRIVGGHGWTPKFFRSMILGDGKVARVRVLEIHFTSMMVKSFDDILDFSEFIINAETKKLERHRYFNEGGKLVYTIITEGKTENGLAPSKTMTFSEFAATKIPQGLFPFIKIFPTWLYAQGSIWDNALQNKAPLYGAVAACRVKRMSGFGSTAVYGVSGQSGEKQENPLDMVKKLTSGEFGYPKNEIDTSIAPGVTPASKGDPRPPPPRSPPRMSAAFQKYVGIDTPPEKRLNFQIVG